MYAIYEKKGKNLSLFEEDEEESFVDLNEAEEILRQLRKERPCKLGPAMMRARPTLGPAIAESRARGAD